MDEQEIESVLEREDVQDHIENQEEQQENYENAVWEQQSEAQVPYQKRPESLFSLFQKVWKSPDSSKVANLDKFELGKMNLSVRDSQYLGLLGKTLRHENFSRFFMNVGEINLSTSASKKGWFTELFVSQKKFTTREAGFKSGNELTQAKKNKWNIFGQTTTQENPQ